MKQFTWTLLFVALSTISSFAQTQVVKGTILDKQSEMPLIGATVELIGGEMNGTTTDLDGYFRLEGIPIGRQVFRVNYLGYNSITIPNVVVTSGKEVLLNISLEESVEELSEVVVTAEVEKDKANNELATISARTFSLEEVNRFSGGRGDVARLAGNFAGVSTADDSRNDIVIRGNSPTGVLWRLEGIPIPNPNHYATLGTSGGAVSALNPNLLRSSDFLTSAFPAEYGNALAGVFDLGFRNGNRDKYEFMVQTAAFSGFEAMAEGPLNKKNNGSFIVAGRYSFVSFAGDIGLDIGTNATPNYSDLAFKVDFGNSPLGKFTLFGIGGTSNIEFLKEEVDEEDLFAATDEDSRADTQFGVVGLKHNYLIDNNTYVRTVIAAANSGNKFTQDRFFNMHTPDESSIRILQADNNTYRYSLSSYINRKFNARLTARAGVLIENEQHELETISRTPDFDGDEQPAPFVVYQFDGTSSMVQPFVQTQYRFNTKWTLNAGLHGQYFALNDNVAVEPRLAINWKLHPNHTLSIGYGLHQQVQPLPILLLQEEVTEGVFEETNRDLKFTRSNHFVLGYDARLGKDWRAKIETYYQALDNVAIQPTPSSFSVLNVGGDFNFPDEVFGLTNEGTGYNTGVELTLEKFFSQGYYGLLTASVFDAKYTGSDGIERNSVFNNGYVVNLLAGKEFKIGKNGRNAILIDTKLTAAGGRYYTPIDLETSKATGQEVRIDSEAYSLQYDPYFRWDLKIGYQLNSKKRKFSQQFYLDLQNVLNRENIFTKRYNRLSNEVNNVYQTGFFPDFMYRIQF